MRTTNFSKIYSEKTTISCDGTVAKSSHPKIYLKISNKKEVTCPYCSLQYVYRKMEKEE